jgi:hypothetical protein
VKQNRGERKLKQHNEYETKTNLFGHMRADNGHRGGDIDATTGRHANRVEQRSRRRQLGRISHLQTEAR